jgi:hypothetical protein
MTGHPNFHGKPVVPATVANLDHAMVTEVLARHACNISDAAPELGVPASDLRRLLWANPQLQDQTLEVVEARLDTAEANIHEALHSEDNRRRDAASFFVVRNSARAKRRGWITSSSAGVDLTVNNSIQARTVTFRWRTADDPVLDSWGEPVDGKLIEHVDKPA